MLIESTAHLPVSLAMFQDVFHMPSTTEAVRIAVRVLHILGGITWIGLLYFFNLVNVPLQKGLDPDTKKKVNPELLGRTLWFFRWGAVLTVLAGLMYFAMYILVPAVKNENTLDGANLNVWVVLLVWLSYPIVLFIVEFLIIKKVPALIKDGRVFADCDVRPLSDCLVWPDHVLSPRSSAPDKRLLRTMFTPLDSVERTAWLCC